METGMATKSEAEHRHLGLFGATMVGVGAIVGGGILALAGAAFAATGPSALLAFALNGVIAMLTALSFAEVASKFPESGGTYTFSKKVLSIEAAFAVDGSSGLPRSSRPRCTPWALENSHPRCSATAGPPPISRRRPG
jgi:amino acid transporter